MHSTTNWILNYIDFILKRVNIVNNNKLLKLKKNGH